MAASWPSNCAITPRSSRRWWHTLGAYLESQTNRDFFRGKLFIVEVHRIRC